jgi:hypothetical protein
LVVASQSKLHEDREDEEDARGYFSFFSLFCLELHIKRSLHCDNGNGQSCAL